MKGIILALILMVSLFSLPTVLASPSCNPSSCPSGYTDEGVDCDMQGTSYTCERECHRDAGCGDLGSTQTEMESYSIDMDSMDEWFYASISESTSKCYQYRSKTQVSITDFDPGWGYDTESYKLYTKSQWDESSVCKSQSSSSATVTSDWGNVNRGSYGPIYGARGKIIPYKSGSCGGGEAQGVEGTLKVILEYKTGNWNTADDTTKTCSGTVDCVHASDCGSDGYVGSEFCKSGDVYKKYRDYSCNSYECDYTETDKLVTDCTSGQVCQGGACVSSCTPKTCAQLGFNCGTQGDTCGDEIFCGSCQGGQNCVSGQCSSQPCDPSCYGKDCGPDGCGGSCGSCEGGETCSSAGRCEINPSCQGNEDCKSLAEVVCIDESTWYKSYSCNAGECVIGGEIPPTECFYKPVNWMLYLGIALVVLIIGFMFYTNRKK